jgi:AbrB family looped-hinge helix DNA binding protein
MSKSVNKVGVIKEIDALGRIVIPKEFRERLNLEKEVEVLLTEDGVIIRNSKYKLIEVKDDPTT